MSDTIPLNQHSISLEQAIAMTQLYRKNRENILNEDFRGRDILPIAETFNKDAFNKLFANPIVKGLRIYYGMSENLQVHAIVVGVDEKNNDLLPAEPIVNVTAEATGDVATDFDILEEAERCPPNCSAPSPLNQP